MDIIVRILAGASALIALAGVINIFVSTKGMKKMVAENKKLSDYIKKREYLLMKNGGDDPCDTKEPFVIPSFSQSVKTPVVRRKMV